MKTVNIKTLTNSQKLKLGFTSGFLVVDENGNPVLDSKGVAYVFKRKFVAELVK